MFRFIVCTVMVADSSTDLRGMSLTMQGMYLDCWSSMACEQRRAEPIEEPIEYVMRSVLLMHYAFYRAGSSDGRADREEGGGALQTS